MLQEGMNMPPLRVSHLGSGIRCVWRGRLRPTPLSSGWRRTQMGKGVCVSGRLRSQKGDEVGSRNSWQTWASWAGVCVCVCVFRCLI